MIFRFSEEKPMLELQTALLTNIFLARSAWTCIFSSQPAWMFFQLSQMSCVQTMGSRRGQRGSSIRIANPIRLSAGCLQNLPRGSATTMGRNFRYPPSATWSGRQGS